MATIWPVVELMTLPHGLLHLMHVHPIVRDRRLTNFGQFENSPMESVRNDRGEFWTTHFLRWMWSLKRFVEARKCWRQHRYIILHWIMNPQRHRRESFCGETQVNGNLILVPQIVSACRKQTVSLNSWLLLCQGYLRTTYTVFWPCILQSMSSRMKEAT